MIRRALTTALLLAAALALPGAVLAQRHPPLGDAPPPAATAKSGAPSASADAGKPAADQTTRHTLALEGRQLAYAATAGTLPLAGSKGETTAHVFYTAYALDAAAAPRPITFVFNGGPGAASAFLHIGAMGPRTVPFNDKGSAALEPVHLADNPDTWLDFTDLVFVDPVSTGYSRAAGGDDEAKDKFFGVDKDADALADFVRLYLTRSGRTLSPVFLAGESYGGFRVSLLAKRLLRAGLDVRGVTLISPAIEFSLVRGDSLMLLPNAFALPSIAASHLELTGAPDLEAKVAEAEAFARGRYLLHLAQGMKNQPDITAALAGYTGLPAEAIARRHGRVSVREFSRAFRRDNDRVLSHYDGGISAPVPRQADEGGHHPDPILDNAVTVLTPAFVAYARGELGYTTDLDYRLLNRGVGGRWDYGTSPSRQGYAGSLDELQEARTQRPSLRILVTGGYTDLVTPFAASRYLIDQLEPIDGAPPVEVKVYRGGHMMYLRSQSRQALTRDARTMYAAAMK